MLTDAIKSLETEEKDYLWQIYRDVQTEGLGIDPALLSDFYPKIQPGLEFSFSEVRFPENICAGLIQKVKRGEKVTTVAQDLAANSKTPVKEIVQEVIVEKTNFDVMLKGFAPESKVKIIKEVKNLMNLGLKESKEMVESCLAQPLVIYKSAPVDKANEILAKFKELGADVELK